MQEELDWYQKSRCQWLKWGDKNSKFFHTSTTIRRSRNRIESLRNDDGEWVLQQEGFKSLAWNYYKDLFEGATTVLPRLRTRTSFPLIAADMKARLAAFFTDEDIREALFDMGGMKAPGPDEIQAIFYQEYWGIVGEAVREFVREFERDPHTICQYNNTNLVLIPKVERPEHIRYFRPIALCNVCYKIITKILSNRLRLIMDKTVGAHQCSFIAGRQSSDNVILAQEVIHSMRTKRKGGVGWMMMKVDLEKAYDCLEWSLLLIPSMN